MFPGGPGHGRPLILRKPRAAIAGAQSRTDDGPHLNASSPECRADHRNTSGNGLAIALRVAWSGHAVTLSYANDDNRAAAALSLGREADPNARLVKADIGTADGAAALVRRPSRRPAVLMSWSTTPHASSTNRRWR